MTFIEALHQYSPLPEAAKVFLAEKLQTISAKKNQILASQGQLCDYLFYVEKGLIRAFHYEGDADVTTFFARENDFMYLMDSFLGNEPSPENIETLEPSVITMVKASVIQELYDRFPETNINGRLITQKYFWEYHQRIKMTYSLNTAERFVFFMTHYSDMLGRMPNKHIASYLGIRPETLSRLLSKNHKSQSPKN